jgi:hypothetical protein
MNRIGIHRISKKLNAEVGRMRRDAESKIKDIRIARIKNKKE